MLSTLRRLSKNTLAKLSRKNTLLAVAAGAALGILALTPHADAQLRKLVAGRANVVGAGGATNLPYNVSDNQGNQWMFYQHGQFQQQGNMPIFSQGAMLQVNGQYPNARNNQATIDAKTGELVIADMPCNGFTVTRRILLNKEEGYVRYIDIIKNPTNAEATPALVLNTNLNYGVQMAQTVADPKKKDAQIAWAAQTHANGRCVVEMYAGKNAKSVPNVQYQQGNSNVQVMYNPPIGAGKEIAWMHFHGITNSLDQSQKFVLGMKESKLMASIPPAIRRLIINFRGGENFIGDYEILRGDLLDVVELRGGDQLKGNLKEKSFKLQTFYGNVELAVDKVIGLINAGEFRPRQLVVTKDGEVFGGKLDREMITLELSSGQVTQIPLSQISRVGYRKRGAEPEEWTFEKPVVLMRTGDRIGVQMPAMDIDISTRYGPLKLAASSIAAVNFQAEEHGVHEVFLTDGSKFAGLVNAEQFEMKLSGEGPVQTVKFPSSSIRRLQLAKPNEPGGEDETAIMNLANEDQLVGTLAGTLKLDTAFSTITLNAAEVKRLVHTPGSPSDVQVVLWDETSVSGQLQEQQLAIDLKSGVQIKVPVALVEDYAQPRPKPSQAAIDTIKQLVAELSAEDGTQRDAAQEKLTSMGPVVLMVLKELRGAQSPEAQQRIDAIVKQLDKDAPAKKEDKDEKKKDAPAAPVPDAPPAALPKIQIEG